MSPRRFIPLRMTIGRFYAGIIAIGIFVAIGTGVTAGLILRAGILHTERQLCHRLNVHRVQQDDRNSYAEWKFANLFAVLVAHPFSKTSTKQELQRRKFYGLLKSEVDTLTWIPPTRSCMQAGSGSAPVRFSVRQPTPQDLALSPGE